MFPRSFSDRRSPYRKLLPLLAVALGFLALSCASTSELARRSSAALAKDDDTRAWQWAERAMKKDPQSPVARDAMTAAAAVVVPDWERRIRALAGSDTVGAARLTRAPARNAGLEGRLEERGSRGPPPRPASRCTFGACRP